MISIDRQQANYAAEECSIMEYMINAKCVPIMQELVKYDLTSRLNDAYDYND